MYHNLPVYEHYAHAFQRHYDEIYGETGQPFEVYEPAYRYGYHLAEKKEHRGSEWEKIVDEARTGWLQTQSDLSWDEVKGAVEHAWSEVKGALDLDES